MLKIDNSTLELRNISETLIEQNKSLKNNDETCANLVKEIYSTRILLEEIITIVDNSTEKLNIKNKQIKKTKKQMEDFVNKTTPILSTTKTLLNEINVNDLTELK